ncbi:MAG: hypothetical protein HY535_00835 [Chloroflexi bacterium]|nr:hypothetical protein [Chloroflexota bacterium]
MGSELEENLFERYSYHSWAPKQLQELFPTLKDALHALGTNPSPEAAMVFFWEMLDPASEIGEADDEVLDVDWLEREMFPEPGSRPAYWIEMRHRLEERNREIRLRRASQLEDLLERLQPILVPDERLREFDVWIFGHMAAALAVWLERNGGGFSERYWEVVDRALALFQRPTTENNRSWEEETEFSLDLVTSKRLVEAFLWSKAFHKHNLEFSSEQALECLYKASMLCAQADSDLYDCVTGFQGVEDWMLLSSGQEHRWVGDKRVESGPGLEAPGAGFHLISHLVPAQEAVDAFDRLFEEAPDKANWDQIARLCTVIQGIWEEPTPNPEVKCKSWPFEQTARDFWVMARGLALKKMSPDALVSFLRQTERSQSESRLRRYFFDDLWERLSAKAQQALIAADRAFWASEGRRDDVFENLRLAVEEVVEQVLAAPFRHWLEQNNLTHAAAASASGEQRREQAFLPISRLVNELWKQSRQRFREFTSTKYPGVDPKFWDRLHRNLRELRDVRGKAVHPEDRGVPTGQAIVTQYRRFLGIGQPGILPKLLELEPPRNK